MTLLIHYLDVLDTITTRHAFIRLYPTSRSFKCSKQGAKNSRIGVRI